MKEQLSTFRELPVSGLAANAKRKLEYNTLSTLLNEMTQRLATIGQRFQKDEQLKLEVIKTSLLKKISHETNYVEPTLPPEEEDGNNVLRTMNTATT